MNNQVLHKIRKIARLRASGKFKDTQIAVEMGMSYGGLQRIFALEEYRMLEQQVKNEHIGKMDEALDASLEKLRNDWSKAVPAACQNIVDVVTGKKPTDLKTQLLASREILDRDPKRTLSKVSRVDNESSYHPAPLPSSVMASTVRDADITADLLTKPNEAPAGAEA